MELPLVLSGLGHNGELVVSIFIGIAFGFSLERAGFGRANHLVSIFYGRDFRVLRVMFTAILTAMMGLYFLDAFGVMPLSNIGLLPSFIVPALVGGLILGVGFVVGGYCPGTSIVAVASGKLDGLLFLMGIFLGTTGVAVAYDSLKNFHNTTKIGTVLLHELFGVSSGVMVLLVAIAAVGTFYGAGLIERRVNARVVVKQSAVAGQGLVKVESANSVAANTLQKGAA
jgi:uncharacterized membrane protein YedE/YeeE